MDCEDMVLSIRRVTTKMVVAGVVAALMVAIPSPVSAGSGGPTQTASAILRTLNNSGVSGRVNLKYDGSELRVTGNATGLEGPFYISLLYDILSVATGDFACEPALGIGAATEDVPARLTLAEMGLDGFPQLVWTASFNGRGSLDGVVDVDLDRVRTISIRDGRINDGIGPEAVAACGFFVVHGK